MIESAFVLALKFAIRRRRPREWGADLRCTDRTLSRRTRIRARLCWPLWGWAGAGLVWLAAPLLGPDGQPGAGLDGGALSLGRPGRNPARFL